MKRSLTAAATIALLLLASALPVQAAVACLAEYAAPTAMPSCCQHAPSSGVMSCSSEDENPRTRASMERRCCCDHEPTGSQSPAQTATTLPNELLAALATPLAAASPIVPPAGGPDTAPTGPTDATESPPAFLLACSFLI